MKLAKERSRAFNVSLLIVLHLAIVLPLAYYLNIWADEASTLHTTQNGFLTAFQHAAADERQAPLYFWIMSLWRGISGSIFFARVFSIICSLAAIKLFADLARRLFEPRSALLATAFFAMHPYLIWASLEIRVYSLVILLSLLILKLFFAVFVGEPDEQAAVSKRDHVYFLLTAIVALYTNYYLGFLLAGCFGALLLTKRWAAARSYLLVMIGAGLAFVPMVFGLISQYAANTSGYREERSMLIGLRYLWHHSLTFMLPAEVFPDEDLSTADILRVWSARAILLVVGIVAVWKRHSISARTILLGAITLTVAAGLFVAYMLIGPLYIEVRHASVLFVPLILFTASFLSDVFGDLEARPLGKLITVAGGLIVLVSFSYALLTLYPNGAKRGDWARVAEYIQHNETPGQPIIVFHTFDAMALPYHYQGVNTILPDERFFDFEVEATFGSADSLRRQTDFTVSKIPPGAAEIWLVTNDKCRVTDACQPLENFVDANYTVSKEQEFYREKVRLLKRKQ